MTDEGAGPGVGGALPLGAVVPVLDPSMSTADLVRLARHAEQQGYDAVFMPEAWGRDALCMSTAFATATERIRIGTAAVTLPPRTPAAVAMASATIDDLSGGRFVLGLGVGHERTTTRWHGLPHTPSLGQMREYVEIVRRIHERREMDFIGEHYRSTHYRLGFQPARSRVPIWLAVLRTGMMRLAGEIADGVLMYFAPESYVERGVAAIEAGLDAAGRARADLEIGVMIPVCVTDDPASARAVARLQVAWYNNLPFYNEMFRVAGFPEEADALAARWAEVALEDPEGEGWLRLETAGAEELVTEEMVDAVVVVGSAAQCRARIERYRALGVDLPIVFPFGAYAPGTSYDGFAATLTAVRPDA